MNPPHVYVAPAWWRSVAVFMMIISFVFAIAVTLMRSQIPLRGMIFFYGTLGLFVAAGLYVLVATSRYRVTVSRDFIGVRGLILSRQVAVPEIRRVRLKQAGHSGGSVKSLRIEATTRNLTLSLNLRHERGGPSLEKAVRALVSPEQFSDERD